ncbi:isoprenylcysteine carboxylmethyltransferase family protein [Eggerthellaceae bacterium zg-887]|uniref:methyltransferase family protein n=1 Tax=Xiamenia xianingshaonis TaxID=2682776 RepID=UPI00140B854C|nr:isoprenylcysteine carboxylmethyltransferase family protein [Xiamenia xianingshaonis]NHM16515.1 isoprenylcysteine carboxylmethyltransferase family protein [Xiamenia xianingshaonis]
MDAALLRSALVKFFAGLLAVGLLLFLPAGTLSWWRGWLLVGVLFVPMFAAGLVMMAKAPDLLRIRLNAREEQAEQRTVVALSCLMFVAAFVVAGLGCRFGWPMLPEWASWAGAAAFLAAYALYAEVMRENAYLSRTVEVRQDQHVVDTGLYGIVRHPMYSATLLLFLSMPVVLGSPFAFVVMLAYVPIIAKRIRNEEKVLADELEGYPEYLRRVRWRLIPHVW